MSAAVVYAPAAGNRRSKTAGSANRPPAEPEYPTARPAGSSWRNVVEVMPRGAKTRLSATSANAAPAARSAA